MSENALQEMETEEGSTHDLREVCGNLSVVLRISNRASRWLLVLLDIQGMLPDTLQASSGVAAGVNVWRPSVHSSSAESYKSFYPMSGRTHVALLDPRSAERLEVWGEPSLPGLSSPSFIEWDDIAADLAAFLAEHSLEEGALGPAHHREKPWAVCTRRVDSHARQETRPPTSVMDDEDAAIAAAIQASLAEAYPPNSDAHSEDEGSFFQGSEDDEDDEDGDGQEEASEDAEENVRGDDKYRSVEGNACGNTLSAGALDGHSSSKLEADLDADVPSSASEVAECDAESLGQVGLPQRARSMPTLLPQAIPLPPVRAMPSRARPSWSDIVAVGSSPMPTGLANRFQPLAEASLGMHQDSQDDEENDTMTDIAEVIDATGPMPMTNIPVPVIPAPVAPLPVRVQNNRSPSQMASSVESLASSYMERMQSRFRSANDPSLLERRLLREEQDAELAASLEADRKREQQEMEEARRKAELKAAQIAAQDRLPEEPAEGVKESLRIALRLPSGARVTRRFLLSAKLGSLADVALANTAVDVHELSPATCLRSPGMNLSGKTWDTPLQDVCSGSRAVMFILHQ